MTNNVPIKAVSIPVTRKCCDLFPIVISTICGMSMKIDKIIIRYPIIKNVVFIPEFISKQLKSNYINIFLRQCFKAL